ncbi:GtrA family protein [Stenotrophomonas sp.]|uniref:GtrA family protein n=1 Tax=Stenotrophomonas sp. TaxID=69392 RepID=UPI0028AADEFA|nr:GtrA family protein [Stenotrophomonas sp.]
MTRNTLIVLYFAFAVISIAVNIGAQAIATAIYSGPNSIPVSILTGTAAGLLCKYILDKKIVFSHVSQNTREGVTTFLLYAATGLITTSIFWATELMFAFAFESDLMRYLGGIVGLTIGYAVKYQLDRRLVFR